MLESYVQFGVQFTTDYTTHHSITTKTVFSLLFFCKLQQYYEFIVGSGRLINISMYWHKILSFFQLKSCNFIGREGWCNLLYTTPKKDKTITHVFGVVYNKIHHSQGLYPTRTARGIQPLGVVYFVVHHAKNMCNGIVPSAIR